MTAAKGPDNSPRNDPFAGFIASIGLALVFSGWFAAVVKTEVERWFPDIISQTAFLNVEAGFFVALVLSNPVGVLVARHSKRRAALRFLLGFCLGATLQQFVFMPIAGQAMSKYLLLFLAASVMPAVQGVRMLGDNLARNGFDVPAQTMAAAIALARLPDRAHFLILMALAFVLTLWVEASVAQILVVQAIALAAITLVVAFSDVSGDFEEDPEEAERRLWLELEPEDEWDSNDPAALRRQLRERFWSVLLWVMPAAVLFGTMVQLAMEFLGVVYPDFQVSLPSGNSEIRSAAMIALSGLAVIFFGLMAGLGFALTSLRLIGRLRNWSSAHLRENYVRLIRALYFRPMRRG